MDDNNAIILGYCSIRQDLNWSEGEVLLYIKDDVKAEELLVSKTMQLDKPLKHNHLFYELWEGTSAPVLIVLVYKPPHVPIRSDRKLVSFLRTDCFDYSHTIITGDWNTDMLKTKSSDTRFNQDLIDKLVFKVVETDSAHLDF